MTKKGQERGSCTETNEADKMKAVILEVSDRSCTKGTWKRFFEVTGDISFSKYIDTSKISSHPKNVSVAFIFFLETWVLPITVLVVIVAYAALAAVFFDMDA